MTVSSGGIKPLTTILALCLALVGAAAPSPVSATDWTDEEDIRNRIDFADRQRMLTQQMALYACFVMADVDRDRYVAKTESVVRQFETYLNALQNGSSDLRLNPERSSAVLQEFEAVTEGWITLGPAVRQVAAGDLHDVPLRQVISLNLDVLETSQTAAKAIHAAYFSQVQDPKLTATIEVAGRLRMLSQMAAKDVCFLNLGLGGAAKKSRLSNTLKEFHTAMRDLQNGSEANTLIAPPNRQVKRQLDRVARVWTDFETLARVLEQGGDIPQGDMIKLANLSQQVLLEMNLAVVMYTQS